MGDTLTWNLVVKDGFSKGLKSFGDTLDNEGKRAHKFGEMAHKGFNIMAAGAVGGAAVAGAAIGKWVVDGVKGAASYNKVLAMTAQVLKSTGNVAGTSVKGVQDLAAQLETMSGVDEELIIHSQNVLATFTSIRNVGKDKIFDQATKSALDMSVALGSDLQGASIQVGKALNDPVKGVTALSKVGVSFTAKQKDTIKALVKTGDTLGAQKLILHELNKEFGGQAEAAGKGFEGAMARAQDAIADTGRSVGELLLPKVTAIADWLSDKIPAAVEDFQAGWSKMAGGDSDVAALATSLHGLANSLRKRSTTRPPGPIRTASSCSRTRGSRRSPPCRTGSNC
jgi:phage-related minor tail protein